MPGKTSNDDLRPTVLLALGLLLILIDLFPFVADKSANRATGPDSDISRLADYNLPASPQTDFLFFRPISINQADKELFAGIPGIGPGISQKIVALRHRKNFFSRLDELLEVRGIGPKKFAEMKKYCRL